jgi:nitrogen fixation protein FixH
MKAAQLWPIAVVCALAAGVAASVVLILAANDPAGTASEPDYYEHAVAWDSVLAARRASEALGWSAAVEVAARGPEAARVAVRITDREARAVDGARVHVTAIHNADGAHWVEGDLTALGEGRYEGVLPLRRAGRWELRLDARRGRERFLVPVHRELVFPAPSVAP